VRRPEREEFSGSGDSALTRDDLLEGWSQSEINVPALSKFLRSIELAADYELAAYLYRSGGNGNGIVYAVPRGSLAADPFDAERSSINPLPGVVIPSPKPDAALADVMEAFRGDGSHRSYMEASVLVREFWEYGALWHGVSWGSHSIIGADPFEVGASQPEEKAFDDTGRFATGDEWTWVADRPDDWRLRVALAEDGSAEVCFHSFSAEGICCYYRHVDRYRAGSLVPETTCEEIARGGGGFVY